MPPRKRQPFDRAVLAPRITPRITPRYAALECGCAESKVDRYFRCPTCGHRRCPTHQQTHDWKTCTEVK